jgi:hypothetical protein
LLIQEAVYWKENFFNLWDKTNTSKINFPFILLHSSNENWGILSTFYPNRTADWGTCCNEKESNIFLKEVMDHPQMLMFITNQHHNFTHPKLLSLPRGLPLTTESSAGLNRKLIWDTMRYLSKRQKNRLNYILIKLLENDCVIRNV